MPRVRLPIVPAILIAAAVLGGFPRSVHAVNIGEREAAIAESHAEDAANSPDLPNARMHLHHVINCLVGPKGNGFDVTVANPCVGLGNGAIADTEDQKKQGELRDAVAMAKEALRAETATAARKQSTDLQMALEHALGASP